jgi:hypothetical protein
VWGIDESQIRFVQKRIGNAGERKIITPEQLDAAIEAAKKITREELEPVLKKRPTELPPLSSLHA